MAKHEKSKIDTTQVDEQLAFAIGLIEKESITDRSKGVPKILAKYPQLSKDTALRLFDSAGRAILVNKYKNKAKLYILEVTKSGGHIDPVELTKRYPQAFPGETGPKDATKFRDQTIKDWETDKKTAEQLNGVSTPTDIPASSLIKVKAIDPKTLIEKDKTRAPIWRAFDRYADDPLTEDIPLDKIVTGVYTPRSSYPDPAHVKELMSSLESEGQERAIVVTPREGKLMVISGEGRVFAARKLKELGKWSDTIRGLVVQLTEEQAVAVALASNLEHDLPVKPLTEIEEARVLKKLIETHGWSQGRCSEMFGKTQRWVSYRLDLLTVPKTVSQRIESGQITATHGREISKAPAAVQERVAEKVVKEDLSVSETKAVIDEVKKVEPEQVSKVLEKPIAEIKTEIKAETPKVPTVPPTPSPDTFKSGFRCECGREYVLQIDPKLKTVDVKKHGS